MRPHGLPTFVVTIALAIVLGWTQSAPAQTSPAEELAALRREVFDLRVASVRVEALREEIDAEGKLLDRRDAGREKEAAPSVANDALWERLLAAPEFQEGKTKKALESFLESAQKEQAKAVTNWRKAEDRTSAFRAGVPAIEEKLGRKWDGAGPGGPWDDSMRQLLALGGVTLALSLLLVLHESRERWRWRLRALGSRPSLILFALALVGSGCSGRMGGLVGAGPKDERQALGDERAALLKALAEADRSNKTAGEKLDARQAEHRRAAGGWLPTPSTPLQKQLAARLQQTQEDEQLLFREVRATARATAKYADAALRTHESLQKDRVSLTAFISEGDSSARLGGIVRSAACGGFLLAALLPLPLVRAHRRRRHKAESRQCPRCLASGQLTVITSDVQDERYPEATHAECGACHYKFRERYLRLPRVCFPTLGIRSSGKTHWLLTAYDMIKNGNVPVRSSLKKMPSLGDTRFDQLIRDTLYNRQAVRGTTLGLPYPLIFHVQDQDHLGRSETTLNLFDWSGEITETDIDQSELRRRSLLFDGFTLFLDPTQLTGRGITLSIEDQIQALIQFHEEMRVVRDIPSGKSIDIPIAVCVSKLDLLTTENPMAGQAEKWLADLRATRSDRIDLAAIHRRSHLCAEVLPQMFPGWNIERTLRENFGGRFMFFPLTPIGLEATDPGADPSHRNVDPFGVLEPILWLLHMHGYCVFN